uniref:YlxR domain-containing protein n=1 Tax=wastewater metagenome TaxID=527639 RepID=A0A0A8KXS7_9ZZZZ
MPTRSCCVCRQPADKAELLRLVAVEKNGKLSLCADIDQSLPGRGVYSHLVSSCLFSKKIAGAVRHGLFSAGRAKPKDSGNGHREDVALSAGFITEILLSVISEYQTGAGRKYKLSTENVIKKIQVVLEQPEKQEKPKLRL